MICTDQGTGQSELLQHTCLDSNDWSIPDAIADNCYETHLAVQGLFSICDKDTAEIGEKEKKQESESISSHLREIGNKRKCTRA